jgi:ketosteroid isomerase-like protein
MKPLFVPLTLTFALIAAAAGEEPFKQSNAPSSAGPEQQLINAEQQWAQAIVKGDEAAVTRLEANDITTVQDDGSVTTKKDDLANLKSGDTKYSAIDESDFHVRVYGNAAVVTGSYHAKGTNKGKDFDNNGRFTDTWVKRNGRWQAVASQDTLITK